MERTSRGYLFQSAAAHLEKAYDAEARDRILGSLSPRVRDTMRDVKTAGWYPIEDVSEVFGAIARHHQATDGRVREALTDVGRAIAEMATNSFLKLVLRVLTPKMFVSKLPALWERDHRCGRLSGLTFEDDKKRIVVQLEDVKGYDFIGPVAPGFAFFALEDVFGYQGVQVAYDWSMDDPGPANIRYDFTWR